MGHNKLVHEVIQAAAEFQERRLWKRFTNLDCFAVRVPAREDLVLACVMGTGGEQFGMMLFQGPQAVRSFAALTGRKGAGDDVAESMDMLGFSMDPFGDIDPLAKEFFRKAGVHPRRDELVPNVLVKPPYHIVRLPNDADLALLLAVLKATIVADRKKLLKPTRLNDRDGICVITPANEATGSTLSVSRQKLAARPAAQQPEAAPPVHLDLAGLEPLDQTWLVGTPTLPMRIEEDDRSTQLLLIAEDASEMILQAKPVFADQMQEAVDAVMDALHGRLPATSVGLPRRIVCSNRKLLDAISPALQEAGVECIYEPAIPKLRQIAEEFFQLTGQAMPPLNEFLAEENPEDDQVPAPDDLAGWKEADRRLSDRFYRFLFDSRRMRSSRAGKRYFDSDDAEYFLQEHEQRGVVMAYAAWGVLDYRPSKTSQTQAEKMLAQGLPQAQAILLRAQMEAYPTIYRVASHNPQAGTVDLEDVLLGGAVTVNDQLLSENIDNNVFLIARAFPAGQFHFIEMAGPPLGVDMSMEAIQFLKECGLEFTPEALRREAHKFGWLWGWWDWWQADWQPPHLYNTDDEEILLHTASFSVADPAEVRQALLRRKGIDYDEQKDEFIWIKTAGQGAAMLGGPIYLGHIEFVGDELVLTVNSAERFEKARKWLTKLPGVAFRDVAIQRVDELGKDRPLDERISKPEPAEITPEMAQALRNMMDKQYRAWLDTPLPILGGKTPRQACRTAVGREQVTLLIRTMPDPMNEESLHLMGDESLHLPRQALLQELGLPTEPPTASPPASWEPDQPGPLPTAHPVGRNDPCPCGSGKKFKKCCGR